METPHPSVLGTRRLDRDSFPMRLWRKAKTLAWDPAAIDLAADRHDWSALAEGERERLLQLCALFHAGEEAVTLEILPLLRAIAAEGRIEEEIFLTSFLFDEAKHVDAFDRFLGEVAGHPGDLSRYQHPAHHRLFAEELPSALRRLDADPSPEAQVRAAVTYHMVVEGVMAETGYYLFERMLAHRRILPGMQQVIARVRQDEARHVAFGIYLISRLVVEHGNPAYRAFLDRMGELRPLVERFTREFMGFAEGPHAFGVEPGELVRHSEARFAGCLQRIVHARTQTLEELRASPV